MWGNLVFLAIGLGAAPACINWDLIARRTGDLNALILAAVLQVLGILLPVLVLSMAGRYYPTMPAKMMGKMTLSYGVAQIIGPALTGMIGAQFGSYNAGLYVAASVMVLGTGLLFGLKAVERRDVRCVAG
jgi:MFS family permease